jgi:hypothetical protein
MSRAWVKLGSVVFLLSIVASAPALTFQTVPPDSQITSATDKSNSKSTPGTVSAADIAAAKASGKVWVNLDSGVYHKGGRWYGKTKNGKFMTADEAKKAGFKAAKRE